MITLLNKSVKNISSSITNLVSNFTCDHEKYNIDLCTIDTMNLSYLKCDKIEEMEKISSSKENQVLILLHSNFFLNLYFFDEFLELRCFYSNKFLFPISNIEKFNLGVGKTYSKDLPLIALISNSIIQNNQVQFSKNDFSCKIYSIKNKKVVHNLRFKKEITNFISKINHFAISFSDFCIKIFENDKMMNIFTIKPQNISKFPVSPNRKSPLEGVRHDINNNCKHFDISDNFIIYYNDFEKLQLIEKIKEQYHSIDLKTYSPTPQKPYTIGNMTLDAFNGIY
jgi:hypothetical protein